MSRGKRVKLGRPVQILYNNTQLQENGNPFVEFYNALNKDNVTKLVFFSFLESCFARLLGDDCQGD